MKKKQKQIVILLVLLAVFGSFWAIRFLGKKKSALISTEGTQAESAPEVPDLSHLEVRAIEYKGKAFEEPFELPVILKAKLYKKSISVKVGPKVEGLPTFTVTGTVWGTDNAAAIINGEIYGIGEKIRGAEILQIDKKGIVLLYQGKTVRINVQRPMK